MFKLHRHKSDRVGEKVEFRFSHIQATQVPRGWDRIIVTISSVETNKVIAKSGKGTVRLGACHWADTIKEAVLISRDESTQEYDSCRVKLVVSMGSVRSGTLGEATLNLADYIASKDSVPVTLPLKLCSHGTVVQLRVQALTPKASPTSRLRDGMFSVGRSRNAEDPMMDVDDTDNQSDESDNLYNRSVGSTSSNQLGSSSFPDEFGNRDLTFSASGSHRSSDSGEIYVGRSSLSPITSMGRETSNFIGRQDSTGSHGSFGNGVGPGDEIYRSNNSSFHSKPGGLHWQENNGRISSSGLTRRSSDDSSRELLEAAQDTIEELRGEARMWEKKARRFKADLESLRKDFADQSKHQEGLDVQLSAACFERDGLKEELEQLKRSMAESTANQNAYASEAENTIDKRKELEDELKFEKESNANLAHQLKKTQDANYELLSILQELEETVEKQKLEIASHSCQTPESEKPGEASTTTPIKSSQMESLSGGDVDLLKEVEALRLKVEELERDCAELTEENLELIYKLKDSTRNTVKDEDSPKISSLQYSISNISGGHMREVEKKENETAVTKTVRIEELEKKCSDLELDLQFFKDKSCDLGVKLQRSQMEVEELKLEITELHGYLDGDAVDGRETDLNIGVKQLQIESYLDTKNKTDVEELKSNLLLREEEIVNLIRARSKLENLVDELQRQNKQLKEDLETALEERKIASNCLNETRQELLLLRGSVESEISKSKMLERNSTKLEQGKNELELNLSELEEENVQLSERISGLEAQLRYLTNEKESNRLEIENSRSLNANLKSEIERLESDMEAQKADLKQRLQEALKKSSEAQEESEFLKRSNSKLQATIESLIDECSTLQKLNGDLRRQKLELYDKCSLLESELNKSRERSSDFVKKCDLLESKLDTLQKDISFKETALVSQLEAVYQEHKEQDEKLAKLKIMLDKIDAEKTDEVETLQREVAHLTAQLSSTHEEREILALDAVREVSVLRADKSKLENSLQELLDKISVYESDLASAKDESENKVQGLIGLLNASKQSEEMLIADIEHMRRLTEDLKVREEKVQKTASELDLKVKASEYENEQLKDEIAGLTVQLVKIPNLQDEILALRNSLDQMTFEKGKLKESMELLSGEVEELKAERNSYAERVSTLQKALSDGEDARMSKVALQEKLLRLEGDLTAREALYAHDAELKNEFNRIKRSNNEFQRKIQCLEEEKTEILRKVQDLEKGLKLRNGEPTTQGESELKDASVSPHEVDLELKIQQLERELSEALQMNSIYERELQSIRSEAQQGHPEACNSSAAEDETRKGSSQGAEPSSLESELKEMQERYSEMSLRYAEVEAQREELVMRLKSMTPRKGKGWFS